MTYKVSVEYETPYPDTDRRYDQVEYTNCPEPAEELATGTLMVHKADEGQELWTKGTWTRVASSKE